MGTRPLCGRVRRVRDGDLLRPMKRRVFPRARSLSRLPSLLVSLTLSLFARATIFFLLLLTASSSGNSSEPYGFHEDVAQSANDEISGTPAHEYGDVR